MYLLLGKYRSSNATLFQRQFCRPPLFSVPSLSVIARDPVTHAVVGVCLNGDFGRGLDLRVEGQLPHWTEYTLWLKDNYWYCTDECRTFSRTFGSFSRRRSVLAGTLD